MVRSLMILSLLASACQPRTDNHLSVSNPIPANGLFPEVVELDVYDLIGMGGEKCSGVFIKTNLLLTAASCIYSERNTVAAAISYTAPDGVMHRGKMFASRKYRPDSNIRSNAHYNLALISFENNVAPAVATLAQTPPVSGETVTIVGFGITDGTKNDDGFKRLGKNRIQSIDDNISVVTGFMELHSKYAHGRYSRPMSADSGGGLFNQRGELISIISSSVDTTVEDTFGNIIGQSYNFNLAHPKSKALLSAINTNLCAGKSLKEGEACQGSTCVIQ